MLGLKIGKNGPKFQNEVFSIFSIRNHGNLLMLHMVRQSDGIWQVLLIKLPRKKKQDSVWAITGGGLWINSSSEFSSKFDSTKKIDSPKFLARPLDDFHRGFRWDPYGFPCD